MVLSKALDALYHDLLIAKHHAYSFHIIALQVIKSYHTNSRQRTKINIEQMVSRKMKNVKCAYNPNTRCNKY